MLKFYNDQIEFVEIEARFHKALAETATARVQELMASQKHMEYIVARDQADTEVKESSTKES